MELNGVRVVATIHAAERARERLPHLKDRSRPAASRWVERTVAEGLLAGRKARRCPRWAARTSWDGYYHRSHAPRRGTSRFVWDKAETCAFVCTRVSDRLEDGAVWVVRTVIVSDLHPHS